MRQTLKKPRRRYQTKGPMSEKMKEKYWKKRKKRRKKAKKNKNKKKELIRREEGRAKKQCVHELGRICYPECVSVEEAKIHRSFGRRQIRRKVPGPRLLCGWRRTTTGSRWRNGSGLWITETKQNRET